MDNNPVITAVTDIAASPEQVWRVLIDFAGYAQWHPILSFADVPTEVASGTVLKAKVSNGSESVAQHDFTVLHYEAPRRLVWEGGVPGVVMGQHSFVLEPNGDGTRYTESEVFSGPAAVQAVEPNRVKMEESYASYGRDLQGQVESGR